MRSLIIVGTVAVAIALTPSFAWGMGSDSPSKPSTQTQPICKKKGYVYSASKKKCVKSVGEAVPDTELKAQGWALAEAGEYDAAIDLFRAVSDPRDAEALNGLGYNHRKLGRLMEGIAYYQQALSIDPGYLRAREYLGEGYVASGQLKLAKQELAEIARRCGPTCEEYVELASAIEGASGQ